MTNEHNPNNIQDNVNNDVTQITAPMRSTTRIIIIMVVHVTTIINEQ